MKFITERAKLVVEEFGLEELLAGMDIEAFEEDFESYREALDLIDQDIIDVVEYLKRVNTQMSIFGEECINYKKALLTARLIYERNYEGRSEQIINNTKMPAM